MKNSRKIILIGIPLFILFLSIYFLKYSLLNGGNFTQAGSLNIPRTWHTATLLKNGQVLIAGGQTYFKNSTGKTLCCKETKTVEIYDPSSNRFILTSPMKWPHTISVAPLLPNGNVFFGGDQGGHSELYNFQTGTFESTGDLNIPRKGSVVVQLQNGNVVVAGGYIQHDKLGLRREYLKSIEVYNYKTGEFYFGGNLNSFTSKNSAILLEDGRILFLNGNQHEIYDPLKKISKIIPSSKLKRYDHTITLLKDGRVLICGGWAIPPINTCELFDNKNNSFSLTGNLKIPRDGQTATVLPHGDVLLLGGSQSLDQEKSAEIYLIRENKFKKIQNMDEPRRGHTATLINDNKVLIIGGQDSSKNVIHKKCEFYLF